MQVIVCIELVQKNLETTVYLIPTLLIVLLVGAVGMLMDAKSARKYRHADRLPSESFIPRT
jgi:hypothetical protein